MLPSLVLLTAVAGMSPAASHFGQYLRNISLRRIDGWLFADGHLIVCGLVVICLPLGQDFARFVRLGILTHLQLVFQFVTDVG